MHIPFSPLPGINSDDTAFASEGRWVAGDGFRFHAGKPETVGVSGLAPSTDVNGYVTKVITATNAAGTVAYILSAGDALHRARFGSASTDLTPASGWFGGERRRSLAMFGNVLLVSEQGQTIFESDLSAAATAVSNAPANITTMLVAPTRQVMALGCNEEVSTTFNGRCIRWCDIEDYTDWTTSSANNAGEYILPGQAAIVGGCNLGEYILVWTESALWMGRFLGDPAQPWAFDKIANTGLVGQDAWAILRQSVYWMAPDGTFHSYTPGSAASLVPCPVSSFVGFADIPEANRRLIFASTISKFGEVWFMLPKDATSKGANSYVALAVDESASAGFPVWFTGTTATMLGSAPKFIGAMHDSSLSWDWAGTFETEVVGWQYAAVGSSPRLIAIDYDNGALGGAYIQSADFYIESGKRRVMVQSIAPDFEKLSIGGVLLTLYVRSDPMAEPVTKGPYTLAFSTELVTGTVNGSPSSGDDEFAIADATGAMAKGVKFTIAGVNGWDGADTGSLKVFTLTEDYIGLAVGGGGSIHFTPALISSGADQNIVSLPANGAAITALTRAGKKDFRASGRIMAAKFTTSRAMIVRFGTPVFDIVHMGER